MAAQLAAGGYLRGGIALHLAIIGGTGVDQATLFGPTSTEEVRTPYGAVSVRAGAIGEQQVFFLSRHGEGHKLPPHRINYRANIWALQCLGVEGVIATSAVGSLHAGLAPGSLVVLDTFLDFTSGRCKTFHDGEDSRVVHTDMTSPYCATLRQELIRVAKGLGMVASGRGCYVCTDGPRYETAAEVRAYALLGGDVVGMTGLPEVVLARELGLCYASIALVTNYGAGLGQGPLTHTEVVRVMREGAGGLSALLRDVLAEAARLGCQTCRA